MEPLSQNSFNFFVHAQPQKKEESLLKRIYEKVINCFKSIKHFFERAFLRIKMGHKVSPPSNLIQDQLTVGDKTLFLKTGDLTKEKADVIVNAANKFLQAGSGVCGAIHNAAGDAPFDELKGKQLQAGQAILSNPGKLPIKGIIHAVGPDTNIPEESAVRESLLAAAYSESLKIAESKNYASIAFPSISTSIFGYSLSEAPQIAIKTIVDYLKSNPQSSIKSVSFVFLPEDKDSQKTVTFYQKALNTFKS